MFICWIVIYPVYTCSIIPHLNNQGQCNKSSRNHVQNNKM